MCKWLFAYHFTIKESVISTTALEGCNSVPLHSPWWVRGLYLWGKVFLVWMRKWCPTETFGTTHKLDLRLFSDSLSMYLTLLGCNTEKRGQSRARHGCRFGAVAHPVCWCVSDEGSMAEWWCVCVWRGVLGSIKTHCGVSGVGHSSAVGSPKAWRGNKDPPMRVYGKDSDITAVTYATAWTVLGKLCYNASIQSCEKRRALTISSKVLLTNSDEQHKILSCSIIYSKLCCITDWLNWFQSQV